MSVTLFAGKETVKRLDRVPLEYTEKAVQWLKEQGFKKIGVDGISKGSEYALLSGSFFNDITCVIARVPSYFVSEGIIKGKGPSGTSCWSYCGKELPFVPYKVREIHPLNEFFSHHELNILKCNTNKTVTAESIIPVEKIKGPVLLLSSVTDTVWPSAEAADHIVDYLQQHNFQHEVKNVKYPNLSHAAFDFHGASWAMRLLFKEERAHPKECAEQRKDLTEQTIDFVRNHW